MADADVRAEAALLGAVLFDADRVLPLCQGIKESDFHVALHQHIWWAINALREQGTPVDVLTVRDALERAGRIGFVENQTNGLYLDKLIDGLPPTAHVEHYIAQVKLASARRTLLTRLRQLGRGLEEGTTDLSDIIGQLANLTAAASSDAGAVELFPPITIDDILSYQIGPDDVLAGKSWIKRGASLLMIGGTGLGKSVLVSQLAVCLASGVPFFGIRVRKACRVLYVQAENDMGMLHETFGGILDGLSIRPDTVRQKLEVRHTPGLADRQLFSWLTVTLARVKPDVLVLDPYQAYVTGDLNRSETFFEFRAGMEPLLRRYGVALVLVTHTPKPREREDWTASQSVYMAVGHSAIANWCRASAELTELADGRFRLRFGKNPSATGLCDDVGHVLRDIYLVQSADKDRPFWAMADKQEPPAKGSSVRGLIESVARRHPTWSKQRIADELGISWPTVNKYYPRDLGPEGAGGIPGE